MASLGSQDAQEAKGRIELHRPKLGILLQQLLSENQNLCYKKRLGFSK
jgi:hypothetical protein